MNAFFIYLALPPYLAQWYANECTKIHNRDNASCPHEVYRFPNPVIPVRGSAESGVIESWLDKQPKDALPALAPDDATIAIQIPSFSGMPVEYYNYFSPSAKEVLVDTIRNRFQVALFSDIHKARAKNPAARIDLLINAWMEKNCIEYNDTNWNAIAKIYQRKRDVYRHTLKNQKKIKNSL